MSRQSSLLAFSAALLLGLSALLGLGVVTGCGVTSPNESSGSEAVEQSPPSSSGSDEDTPSEPGQDAPACDLIEEANSSWTVCEGGLDYCAGFYAGGEGCDAYCAAAGLVCAGAFELLDVCEPDSARVVGCGSQADMDSAWCECAVEGQSPGGSGDDDDVGAGDLEGTVERIRIQTEQSPSWVSWGEIEVIGTWHGQDMEPANLAIGAVATASSSIPTAPPGHAIDGDEGTGWNAGDFPPAWIEIQLPDPAFIQNIHLRVNQSPPGVTRHLVQLGSGSGDLETVGVLEGSTSSGDWLSYAVPDGSDPPPPDDPSDGGDTPAVPPAPLPCGSGTGQPALQWSWWGTVASGSQIDAVRGPQDRVHLVSDRYYQFDCDGQVVVDEPAGDGTQSHLDFPPALAVGNDGSVHLVTRHGGSWNGGRDIRYRRRNTAGAWDRDYLFGGRVKRNYVVGVAWAGPDQVFLSSSHAGSNVWGDLRIWSANATEASEIGRVGEVWRADADSRMRGIDGRVFLVSGEPNGGGRAAYFMASAPSGALASDLSGNQHSHVTGGGRTGFPDLYVDGTETVHFTYGAQEEVHYNKYDVDGQRQFSADQAIFTGLGSWHLSSGLSAVAASDDGNTVVAVALRSDGSQAAGNSDIFWAYSTDAGATWSAPQDTGHNTHAGEGRRRPRMVAVGERFFLFYDDRSSGGISMATLVTGN